MKLLRFFLVIILLSLVSNCAHTNYSLSDDQIPKMSDEQLFTKLREIVAEIYDHADQLNGINRTMSATCYSDPANVPSGFVHVAAGFHHKAAGNEALRQGRLIEAEIHRRGLKIPGEP